MRGERGNVRHGHCLDRRSVRRESSGREWRLSETVPGVAGLEIVSEIEVALPPYLFAAEFGLAVVAVSDPQNV